MYDNAESWVRITNIVHICKNKKGRVPTGGDRNGDMPNEVHLVPVRPALLSLPLRQVILMMMMMIVMMMMTMLKVDNWLSCPFLFGSYTYEHTFMVFHTDMSFLTTWDFPFCSIFAQCVSKNHSYSQKFCYGMKQFKMQKAYNIFCDLSKLRSNFEGDDANPFLWDTPTPLYMQHKIYKIFKIPVPTGRDSNKQCAKQMLLLAKIPCTWWLLLPVV